jgi:hypothetical protein
MMASRSDISRIEDVMFIGRRSGGGSVVGGSEVG